jgi:cobaltochelatase CobN
MRALLLSTADTELLAARAADAGYLTANPARVALDELDRLTAAADVVLVRLLGGRKTWPDGVAALRASDRPVILLGGEADPDAELMALSTVPAGVAAEAFDYLREGGVANLRELARFLSDTLLLTGDGFAPPVVMPGYGVHGRYETDPARPTVAVVFYRAHELSGNTGFVDTLCAAIEERGGNALPVFCGSLRGLERRADERAERSRVGPGRPSGGADGHEPPAESSEKASATENTDSGLLELLGRADAVITTVLAAGAATDADAWDAGALATLDVPVIQGLCLTTSRTAWEASDAALSPLDAAMQVAIPEFDGRLVSVPFSAKEDGPDGIPIYVADPERAARVAGIAVRHARLRRLPNASKRIAVVLSSYPTKHSRVGNAVGLDTPASAVRLLRALADAGYDLGGEPPADGDELIHALIAAGGHDVEWLTEEQLRQAPARVSAAAYERWFAILPESLRAGVRAHWGEPPGELYTDGGDIVVASLRFGNVVLMIQPPRGFGENPVAIYHDPDLPPSHHYLAAYHWLDTEFGADAVIHLGKHGTLEWLPGKGLGLSAGCAPDAVLGDLPLVYPFIVNDPGEGTQAKRRGHATIVDHLVPPMARADSYGDLARLEQLLDEYATVQALDPAKLPAVRAQVWTLVQAAQLHHDLHVSAQPGEAEFDDFVLHIDGYLCEIKDVQIRDGLHILGAAPSGEARVNLVLAILRAAQIWGATGGGGAQPGGRNMAVPGLRAALAESYGLDEKALLADPGAARVPLSAGEITDVMDGPSRTASDVVDLLEGAARKLVLAMEALGWDAAAAASVTAEVLGRDVPAVAKVLEFAAAEVVPRLAGTRGEIDAVLHALAGGYVPAGPSGSPTRGLVNVLPTGRNFYSVDPKAIPSRNAWDVGAALADSLIDRHRADTGEYPRCVGLTVWGTSAMRTQGDDIAEVLALIGVRPVWDDASRRVTGFEVIPLAELGRPRIDVTLRISGFFRDAFPHVIAIVDDAITTVAGLPEPIDQNYPRAHALADHGVHGDWRRATTRIFGSKPGAYGAGLLPLIDARNWRDDRDLAEVYAVWGGYAYGRGLDGRAARRHGGVVPADLGRRQEPGHQGARHRRLRRLLPVPRRHGGHGPVADRVEPGGLRGRLGAARPGEDPYPRRGDAPGVPRPGGEPAMDRRDAAARLQGRVRAGRDRRLSVRLRRDRGRGRRLDVREARRRIRLRPGDPQVHGAVQPVGAARRRRAAAGGRRPRPVGRAGRRHP